MSKRNYGIDFLRIISMLMVVMLHVLLQGGILDSCTRFSFNYEFAWFLETACICAVNCYALISGFVGIDAQFKYSNIVYLWLQVLFCRVLVAGFFFIFIPGSVTIAELIKAFFPILFSQHWYFNAYLGMFFFIPCFNHIVNTFPKKQIQGLMFIIILLFSFLPTLRRVDYFCLSNGYSTLWLSLLYLMGAYIKKFQIYKLFSPLKAFLIYFLCIFLSWSSKLFIELSAELLFNKYQKGVLLITYTSPTILFAAIALLLCFSSLDFSSRGQRIIAFLAPLSFSVYLIHTHPLVWDFIMSNRFAAFSAFSPVKFIIFTISTVFCIYLLCSFSDLLRFSIFKKIKIKQKCYSLDMFLERFFQGTNSSL